MLAETERKVGIAERLARCIEAPRDPQRVSQSLAEMIRYGALLVAAGCPADTGSASRFVVTSLRGAPRWLYAEVYYARRQTEHLIKAAVRSDLETACQIALQNAIDSQKGKI